MLLQTILGIDANASQTTVYVNPTLPEWLPEITITNMRVGKNKISLRFRGTGKESVFEVLDNDGQLRVKDRRIWTRQTTA